MRCQNQLKSRKFRPYILRSTGADLIEGLVVSRPNGGSNKADGRGRVPGAIGGEIDAGPGIHLSKQRKMKGKS
jgi:hypothetical protein